MAAKKTLYHSELVKNSPATLTVKSDIKKSKYPTKPNYMIVQFQGQERLLDMENAGIEEFLAACEVGRTLVLNFTGSREDASVEYIGEGTPDNSVPEDTQPPPALARRVAPPPPRAPAPPAPPQHTPAPPQRQARPPHDTVAEARMMAARLVNLRMIATSAALYFRDQLKEQFGVDQSPELTHATATSFMIALERSSFLAQMPVAPLVLGRADEPSDNDGHVN